MSEHTAGPWKIDRRRSWDEIRDAHGIVLAQVTALGRNAKIAQANACLIAAAPELLEALTALTDAVEDAWPGLASLPHNRAARAAIAKATQTPTPEDNNA